jgi:hypothetical protein
MNHLNDLLERAAGPAGATVDARHDLSRGHRALARTRVRRSAAGLVGVAAAGVIGVGLTQRGGDEGTQVATDPTPTGTATATPTPTPTPPPTQDPVPSPYELPELPAGWTASAYNEFATTFAPPGATVNDEPGDFEGTIVLLYDKEPTFGKKRVVDGRAYFTRGDSGYTTISTRTRPDEPQGTLRLQFPDTVDVQSALAFLSGVRVLDGAQPAVG